MNKKTLLEQFIKEVWSEGNIDACATVYYFEGDRITGHWQVTDRLSVFQQLRSTT